MQDKRNTSIVFGLTIGIDAVGWAVLAENRIIDLGVRAFRRAEAGENGEPVNLVRRLARLARRRLRRRAARMSSLFALLQKHGLVADRSQLARGGAKSPWELRVEGLDRCLTPVEWARVIYHLCNHRGFHWGRGMAPSAAETASEDGSIKEALAKNLAKIAAGHYRTAGEMLVKETQKEALIEHEATDMNAAEAQGASQGAPPIAAGGAVPGTPPISALTYRNKAGAYDKALSRAVLGDEMACLFAAQRAAGNPAASPELEVAILGNGDHKSGIFWQQKPTLTGTQLQAMVGECTFEKGEYRAPKASFTAERHVWLTRLNTIRLSLNGDQRPLTPAERAVALPLPYHQAGDLTYRQLRGALTKADLWPEGACFAHLAYPTPAAAGLKGPAPDPENQVLAKVPAWQALRQALQNQGLDAEWQALATAALCGEAGLLDEIGVILTLNKEEDVIMAALRGLPLPGRSEAVIQALLPVSFSHFHALSLRALRRIVPFMAEGLRYDQACKAAGYHPSQVGEPQVRRKYLPSLYLGRTPSGGMRFNPSLRDMPRNPVVLRSIQQGIKVLNALSRAYGSPTRVHIEIARDLPLPFQERAAIRKAQEKFREAKDRAKAAFAVAFDFSPNGRDLKKFQLYQEQKGLCAYSLQPLDLQRVIREPGYAELDHVLPYSRSLDSGQANLVLTLATENHAKGNRTPYEYLSSFAGGEANDRWQRFVATVQSNPLLRQAKRNRLLRRDFGQNSAFAYRQRYTTDTHHIARWFKNHVDAHLALSAPDAPASCVMVNRQVTAYLHARWGLHKDRRDDIRHHALTAAVVAACSRGMVQRVAVYARYQELAGVPVGFTDPETDEVLTAEALPAGEDKFPQPWPHFSAELRERLMLDDPDGLREAMRAYGTYRAEDLAALTPLFVSWAPQRRNGGGAHKATIYAQPARLKAQGAVTERVPVTKLTLSDLDSLVDSHCNVKLYAAIKERLLAHHDDGIKAFPPDNPLRKPGRSGALDGPIVRKVTRRINKMTGIAVRGGLARNDTLLRLDVFRQREAGKFHLVPVYAHQAVARTLPDRAIVASKPETEWTRIDGRFAFCFSLYPYDLVRVTTKTSVITGYYLGCNRSTGALQLMVHDRARAQGVTQGIGVKTALALEKLHVDVLGQVYRAPAEVRRGVGRAAVGTPPPAGAA